MKPGKAHPLVPHSEGFALHLSQASLAPDVKAGTRAAVLVKLGPKEQAVVLCTLCAGSQDTVLLDQFFTEYAELSIQVCAVVVVVCCVVLCCVLACDCVCVSPAASN